MYRQQLDLLRSTGVIEMHGTIFFHLQRFAERVLGPGGWTKLFEEAGLPMQGQ